jgi:D-alanyl-D-alanine carboxypeptidase (penicillin-binding protein 5/6)
MNGPRLIPRKVWVILALLVIVGLLTFQLVRPLPVVAATPAMSTSDVVPGAPPAIPLPAKGEAAVGTAELGILGASQQEQALPMASVAKLMTALVLIGDKPLAVDETGPAIVIDAADVADYQTRLAAGESVLKVAAGEQITEFDALQGLLIPSGNNIAAVLGKWDAGSADAMVRKLNERALAMHLTNTHFEDTAGVSPKTVSSPSDLFRIAVAAMKNNVIAKVVGEVQAVLPVAGVVYNVNSILGQDGIIGIKTGSGIGTATGSLPISNFVFASKQMTGAQPYVIYGAVMGQDTLADAFKATAALIDAVKPAVQYQSFLTQGAVVASYKAPWGATSDVAAGRQVSYFAWPGLKLRRSLTLASLTAPVGAGRVVGHVTLTLGEQVTVVALAVASPLDKPGLRWRLTRIS